jgi:GH25 family lysozyme M1 (1,4-beta-N-acetylmuramidase)
MEGRAPSKRISGDNPVHKIHGIVADYDSPIDWNSFDAKLNTSCAGTIKPTWSSKTYSGYLRLVWEFEESIPIDPSMFDYFI